MYKSVPKFESVPPNLYGLCVFQIELLLTFDLLSLGVR